MQKRKLTELYSCLFSLSVLAMFQLVRRPRKLQLTIFTVLNYRFYKNHCPPKGHHDEPALLLDSEVADEELPSVEKVVVPSEVEKPPYNSSLLAGVGVGAGGAVSAGGADDRIPILGKSPPCVGGAVTSCRIACS